MEARFLVTGSGGCIGAWTVAQLVHEGTPVVAFDASPADHRLKLVLNEDELAALDRVTGDITDLEGLERTLDEHGITHVIHLAALQVPFCRADPPLGARVNVVGTVNVFEAVARRGGPHGSGGLRIERRRLRRARRAPPGRRRWRGRRARCTASSSARTKARPPCSPQERGVASTGLRPHTVYGPGRDQGLTSAPTTAMLHAAAGLPYKLPFGGAYQLQYAPDVADAFIAASAAAEGATVKDIGGAVSHTDDVIEAITAAARARRSPTSG